MEIPCINKVILSILSYLIRKPIPINFIVGGGGVGGGQWNIIPKHYFRYHIPIVYSKCYERKNPKLSQTTQEVASVRGLSLFTVFFIPYISIAQTNWKLQWFGKGRRLGRRCPKFTSRGKAKDNFTKASSVVWPGVTFCKEPLRIWMRYKEWGTKMVDLQH